MNKGSNHTLSETIRWEFWRKRFDQEIESIPLPMLKSGSGEKKVINLKMDSQQMEKISSMCSDSVELEYTFFVSAFAILLGRYFGHTSVQIGSSISVNNPNQKAPVFLILYSDVINSSFKEIFSKNKQEVFDVIDYYQENEFIAGKVNESCNIGFSYKKFATNDDIDHYDLFVNVIDNQIILYASEQIDSQFLDLLGENFLVTINQVIQNPYGNLTKDLALKTEYEFGSVSGSLDESTLVDTFTKIARECPDKIAIESDQEYFSYGLIDHLSDRIAQYICQSNQVIPDSIIAIYMDKSPMTILSILGVLKCGAAYLPLDTEHPVSRINQIMQDAQPIVVLTVSDFLFKLPELKSKILCLDIELPYILEQNNVELSFPDTHNLAYLIYTSGSTGVPKGVLIRHKNVWNTIQSQIRLFELSQRDKVLLFAKLTFDASVSELFITLLSGATLIIPKQSTLTDHQHFFDYCQRKNVNTVTLTPSYYKLASKEQLELLDKLISAGESMDMALIQQLDLTQVYNAYGPTETSICATIDKVEKGDFNASIGVPIDNTKVVLLDENNNPVPYGGIGYMNIGGAGLAKGYLNNPELTNEKFRTIGNDHLYDSGDLAQWCGGKLKYFGRKDEQVKIRGIRVEISEIERVVLTHPFLIDTACIYSSENGSLYLFYQASEAVSYQEIKSFISNKIPEYMIPAFIIEVNQFFYTSSNKVDKSKLLAVYGKQLFKQEIKKPINELQRKIVELVKDNLKIDDLGINQNYFSVGGDSIKAISLVLEISKRLDVQIEVKDLFANRTIEELSEFIQASKPKKQIDLAKLENEFKRFRKEIPKEIENYVDVYPMSDIQQGMIFHSIKDQDSGTFVDQTFHQLRMDEFDEKAMTYAIEHVVDRHEILRTGFLIENETPLQFVTQTSNFTLPVEYKNIQHLSEEEKKIYCQDLIDQDRNRPINPKTPGLWRIYILVMSSNEIGLLFVFHHAIMDGWSDAVFLTDLFEYYEHFKSGSNIRLTPLRLSQKTYVASQQLIKQNETIRSFWKSELQGYDKISLPFNKEVLNSSKNNEKNAITYSLPEELVNSIYLFCEQKQIPVKHVLFAAYIFLVHGLTNEKDVVVGLVTNTRPELEDADKLVGCFLNTIPFRSTLPLIPGTIEFIESIDNKINELKAYDKLSLLEIVKETNSGALSENPFYDIIFNYVDFHLYDQISGNLKPIEPIVSPKGKNNSLFEFTINGSEKDLSIYFATDFDLYSEIELHRIIGYYSDILSAISRLAPLNLNKVLQSGFEFDRFDTPYHENLTCTTLFDHIGKTWDKWSGQKALIDSNGFLTYAQLQNHSNQFAYFLKDIGLNKGDIVAIIDDRSKEMISMVLGIMKAGGVYLPILPDLPESRINYHLEDSNLKFLFVGTNYINLLSSLLQQEDGLNVITNDPVAGYENIHIFQANLDAATNQVEIELAGDDLAYVLYTSGTTGYPKGVMIEHKGMLNHLLYKIKDLNINHTSILAQNASQSFDISIWQFFAPLLTGGTVRIYSKDEILDIQMFCSMVERDQLTHLEVVPSYLHYFIDHLQQNEIHYKGLKYLIVTGEELKPSLVERWFKTGHQTPMVNAYGPTEASDDITHFRIEDGDKYERIPIGFPIEGMDIRIENKWGDPCPVGVKGEIIVRGIGVGRGYLNDLKKTSNAFYKKGDTRYYKTGDIGRFIDTGAIEFFGREDNQVKIRGHRIELGEIENQLSKLNKVKDAVVNTLQQKELTDLVAYVINESGSLDVEQLKIDMANVLPDYMIPSYVIEMESFPLTPNGKVDRERLPHPELVEATNLVKPKTEIQVALCEIWSLVLDKNPVGVNDNFFSLGGHSLIATRLVSKINEKFGISITLRDIFNNLTVIDQEKLVIGAEKKTIASILAIEEQDYYNASHSQKRMWLLSQFEELSAAYNTYNIYYLSEGVHIDLLEEAIDSLSNQHEILRTTFVTIDGEPKQYIHPNRILNIDQYDLSQYNPDHPVVKDKTNELVGRVFNLEEGPLARLHVFHVKQGSLLIVNIHHIISDGWSTTLFNNELLALYESRLTNEQVSFDSHQIQYKDYTAWQNTMLSGEALSFHRSYWLEKLSGDLPVLELPSFKERPNVQTFNGKTNVYDLGEELSSKMALCAAENGVTKFMFLLSCFNVLFHKYSGQQDIIIGTSSAGRGSKELEKQIGFYINTLALRTNVDPNLTFTDFLNQQKEDLISSFEHEMYPFDRLVEELNLRRDLSRAAVFDILVEFQNFDHNLSTVAGHREESQLDIEYLQADSYSSILDLNIMAVERDKSIYLEIRYNTDVFEEFQIDGIVDHYKNLIQVATNLKETKISDLAILSDQEREELRQFHSGPVINNGNNMFPSIIDQMAEQLPERIALVDSREEMTYKQVVFRSNQIANLLIELGITSSDFVGVLMDRSADMIVMVLGIMKAGTGYLPLLPDDPLDRLKYQVEDASVNFLLFGKDYINKANVLQWSSNVKYLICSDTEYFHEVKEKKNRSMDQELWEYIGSSADDDIKEGGWISSFTGDPFSRKEMEEYVDNTYKKLAPYLTKNSRVLEIGCGSGLTTFRLAPEVEYYYAIDLSRVIVDKNRARSKELGLSNVVFESRYAHQIDQIQEENFDIVIINSVIQNFNGYSYLRDVLDKSLTKLAGSGIIFLGDIMDDDKRDLLITSLKEFSSQQQPGRYKTKLDWQEEFFVSKRYLNNLKNQFDGIKEILHSEKIYSIENELTRFRYDTIIEVNKKEKRKTVSESDYLQLANKEIQSKNVSLNYQLNGTQIAYLIYTSGTTGVPKGALIEHRGMLNHLWCKVDDLKMDQHTILAQNASQSFDISLWQFFSPLLVGGKVRVFNKDEVLQVNNLLMDVVKEKITHLEVVPSYLHYLLDEVIDHKVDLPHLKYLIVTGEELKPNLVNRWFTAFSKIPLVNAYGPTEASDDITHYQLDSTSEMNRIPIGYPIRNMVVSVLDSAGELCPIGVKGEIVVSGIGVGCGYLNDAEKTADKFIMEEPRTYYTGDVGRYLPTGELEFYGRKDNQVKVLGHRIELGEIEKLLSQVMGVKDAVVRVNKSNQQDLLVGYVVLFENAVFDSDRIRNDLSKKLPEYSIPSYLVEMDSFPLTNNGKIDYKKLPDPTLNQDLREDMPTNDIQLGLKIIWEEVLERSDIGIKDNFFLKGGHSLKATRLLSRINERFYANLTLANVFTHPTIIDQSELVKAKKQHTVDQLSSIEDQEYYSVSHAQKRLWAMYQFEHGKIAYNEFEAFRFNGSLNLDKLNEAFVQVINRHEILRTVFKTVEGVPKQFVLPMEEVDFAIQIYDYTELDNKEESAQNLITTFKKIEFDLEQGPLIAAIAIKMDPTDTIFCFITHHIIGDGWSTDVLVQEVILFYEEGRSLPELEIQYRDFAAWQNNWLNSGGNQFIRLKKYWNEKLFQAPEELNFVTDYALPEYQSFDGDEIHFTIDEEQYTRIISLSQELNTTLYVVLVSLLNTYLAKTVQQEDVLIGTPIAGRSRQDLENQIGFYLNTVVLRNQVDQNDTFKTLVEKVHQNTMQAFDHQDYPFDLLVDDLKIQTKPGRTPLFNVWMVLQNTDINLLGREVEMKHLQVERYVTDHKISQFDLAFSFNELDSQVYVTLEYNTALFEESTILLMKERFLCLVEDLLKNQQIQLGEIQLRLEEYNAVQSINIEDDFE